MNERRNIKRRKFAYYMRVLDDDTLELIGHLSDISNKGFKIDSQNPIAPGISFRLRMDLTSEVSNKAYILFSATSRWCRDGPHWIHSSRMSVLRFPRSALKIPPSTCVLWKNMGPSRVKSPALFKPPK